MHKSKRCVETSPEPETSNPPNPKITLPKPQNNAQDRTPKPQTLNPEPYSLRLLQDLEFRVQGFGV